MLNEAGRLGNATAIALVEDDREMRSMLHDFLTASGFEVHDFPSAAHFLRVLRASGSPSVPFSLVISDMYMPGAGGMELLRETRKKNPGLPVILMTAIPSGADERAAKALGGNVYLQKPFPLKELLRQIQWSLCSPAAAGAGGA